jgi:hypothetical protein
MSNKEQISRCAESEGRKKKSKQKNNSPPIPLYALVESSFPTARRVPPTAKESKHNYVFFGSFEFALDFLLPLLLGDG